MKIRIRNLFRLMWTNKRQIYQAIVVLSCLISGKAAEQVTVPDEVVVGPDLWIQFSDGTVKRSRFVDDTPRLIESGVLANKMVLEFANGPIQPQSASPVTIATLWTGEVIPSQWSRSVLSAGISGKQPKDRFAMPDAPQSAPVDHSIASVRLPEGCVDVCPAGHKSGLEGSWQAVNDSQRSVRNSLDSIVRDAWGRQRVRVSPPVEEGLVTLSGRWPTTSRRVGQRDMAEGILRFLFRNSAGDVQALEVARQNQQLRLLLPDGREKTARNESESVVIQMRLSHGLRISSHNAALARMTKSPGLLIGIEAEGAFLTGDVDGLAARKFFKLDQPWVRRIVRAGLTSPRRYHEILNSIRRATDRDRVILNTGDELYGAITESHQAIYLHETTDKLRRRLIDRSVVHALCFGRPVSQALHRAEGIFSQVDLVPDVSCSLAGPEESFWIRTAIISAHRDGLRTRHPLLGEVLIRWPMIRRITPLYIGMYHLIHAGPIHLGNGYRNSFSRVEPDGTQFSFEMLLNREQLSRNVFLSADVAELIPSGPDTLKATPFLSAVRAGYLATYVIVNGEEIGRVNDLISVQSPTLDPERLRMRLPTQFLKEGRNTIVLRQTAAQDDVSSFDDCEFRALAIEIEN